MHSCPWGHRREPTTACISALPEHLWPRQSGVIIEDYSVPVGGHRTHLRPRWALSGRRGDHVGGTLAAQLASLTGGVFGFKEYLGAPLVVTTIIVETAGTVVLTALTAMWAVVARRG